MKALTKIAAGGVGLFALVGAAAPAAAQYPGYGYGGGDVLSTIINQVLRGGVYGSYGQGYGYNPQNERYLVEQCARVTEARLQRNYGYAGYNRGYGYQGYNNGYSAARIVNITRVERRSRGGVKIFGVATSGQAYGGGYGQSYGYPGYGGGYGGYGGGYGYAAPADLQFDCTIDYRGRVTDVDISRNRNLYRGY